MKEIQIFMNPDFGQIRAVDKDGEAWFVAVDVCKALDISNSRDALSRLDNDEKAAVGLTDTSSNGVTQAREFTIVNEPGLYQLIFRSRKPEAKAMRYRTTLLCGSGLSRIISMIWSTSFPSQRETCSI